MLKRVKLKSVAFRGKPINMVQIFPCYLDMAKGPDEKRWAPTMQFRKWLMKWTIIPPFHSHNKNVNQQWPNNIRGIPMLLFQLHPPRSKQARDRISKFYFLFLGVLDAWRGQCVLLLCKNCCSKSLGICAFEFCPCRKKRVAQHLDRVVLPK